MSAQNHTHWSGQTYNPEYLAHFAIVPYAGGGYCYLPNYVGARGFALTERQCDTLTDVFLEKERKSRRILSNLIFGGTLIVLIAVLPRIVEFYTGSKGQSSLAILAVVAGGVWFSNHRKIRRFLKVVPDAVRCRHGRPWRYFVLRQAAQESLWPLGLKSVGFGAMGLIFLLVAIVGAFEESMRNSAWVFALFSTAPILLVFWGTASCFWFGLRFRMKNGRPFTPADLPQISPVTGKCVPPI